MNILRNPCGSSWQTKHDLHILFFHKALTASCKYCGCARVCIYGVPSNARQYSRMRESITRQWQQEQRPASTSHACAHRPMHGYGETKNTCHMSNGQLSVFYFVALIQYYAMHTPFVSDRIVHRGFVENIYNRVLRLHWREVTRDMLIQ